ncbi:uncharacterized protein EAF01_006190 [Botrytis porri]|uniref:Uncharacterized protein n=1 Tax=Botrytis porri TaxID=87229 RepID=A0A4Z1KMV0_9HELO|nr:uncharacterized protein EAF01_006190 [Botrytis porri]KAF7903141.1 hypothetical protein EAF01_006190 [Botrytis porri]TGO84934.1 hypothetical protein BPOR_0449g00050 [Botrytis porri]
MCLRTMCHYTLCDQTPYSWIIQPCTPLGTCERILTKGFPLADFCPECYMVEDPTTTLPNQAAIQRFGTEYEFDRLHFEESNFPEKANAVLNRVRTFVNMNFEPDVRDNLDIFCSNERLNLDVFNRLWLLVFQLLLPHLWLTVRAGRAQKIPREHKIIILQLRQAILRDLGFNFVEAHCKERREEGKWRQAMGAHAPIIAEVCVNPPVDRCMICLESLNSGPCLKLKYNHTYHKDYLTLMVEFKGCAIYRDECRGPLPDISVKNEGPWPEWLEVFAPFQRPRVQEELLAQPPPTDREIRRLEAAFNRTHEDTARLYERVLRDQQKLSNARLEVESSEYNMQEAASNITELEWVVRNNRMAAGVGKGKEPIRESYTRLTQMLYMKRLEVMDHEFDHIKSIEEYNKLPSDSTQELNHRLYRQREWIGARNLYYTQKRKHTLGLALESVYYNILSFVGTYNLRTRREGEGEAEERLSQSEHLWRQSILARDDAKDRWDFALYHKSIFESNN